MALANSWQRQQLRQYNWRNVANAAQADPQYQPVRNNIRSRVQLVGLGVALIGVAIECHNNPGESELLQDCDINPQIQIANQLRVSQPIVTADYTK